MKRRSLLAFSSVSTRKRKQDAKQASVIQERSPYVVYMRLIT